MKSLKYFSVILKILYFGLLSWGIFSGNLGIFVKELLFLYFCGNRGDTEYRKWPIVVQTGEDRCHFYSSHLTDNESAISLSRLRTAEGLMITHYHHTYTHNDKPLSCSWTAILYNIKHFAIDTLRTTCK